MDRVFLAIALEFQGGFVLFIALVAALAAGWRRGLSVLAGGAIGFAPFLALPRAAFGIAVMLVFGLALVTLIVTAALRRRMIIVGLLSASILLGGSSLLLGDRPQGILHVFGAALTWAMILSPLVCAVAACSLAGFLSRRRRAVSA